jgi:hypothetical protein
VGGALFRNERLLMFWVVFYAASMTKRLLMFEVQLDGEHGELNRHECSGQPGTGQGFCLGDSRVAEVLRIMPFLLNAIIRGRDFGIPGSSVFATTICSFVLLKKVPSRRGNFVSD